MGDVVDLFRARNLVPWSTDPRHKFANLKLVHPDCFVIFHRVSPRAEHVFPEAPLAQFASYDELVAHVHASHEDAAARYRWVAMDYSVPALASGLIEAHK